MFFKKHAFKFSWHLGGTFNSESHFCFSSLGLSWNQILTLEAEAQRGLDSDGLLALLHRLCCKTLSLWRMSQASGESAEEAVATGLSDTPTANVDQMDAQSVSQHVSAIASSNAYQIARTSDIRMPWQKGPLAPIFNQHSGIFRPLSIWNLPRVGLSNVGGCRPIMQMPLDLGDPLSSSVNFAKQRLAAEKFYVPEDELRTKVLNQFKLLLLIDLKATRLGTFMMDAVGSWTRRSMCCQSCVMPYHQRQLELLSRELDLCGAMHNGWLLGTWALALDRLKGWCTNTCSA